MGKTYGLTNIGVYIHENTFVFFVCTKKKGVRHALTNIRVDIFFQRQ